MGELSQRSIRCVLLIAAIAISFGCGGGGGSTAPPSVVLQSITIAPANSVIELGNNQQYSATGKYSDGTTKDLSSTATWSSNNPAVATLDSSGRYRPTRAFCEQENVDEKN